MASKQRKDQNGKTVSDKTNDRFIAWIADQVYSEYGLGKTDNATVAKSDQKLEWLTAHEWTADKEKFVINRSKLFIRLLDSADSNSTNVQFLQALVNRMTAHLLTFCQRAPNRSRGCTRQMLKEALFENNSYVRGLQLYQQERRTNMPPRTQKTVSDKKKRQRIDAQKQKREIERQVRFVFFEVASYRKK